MCVCVCVVRLGGVALKLTTVSDHSGQSVDKLYNPQKIHRRHTNTRVCVVIWGQGHSQSEHILLAEQRQGSFTVIGSIK